MRSPGPPRQRGHRQQDLADPRRRYGSAARRVPQARRVRPGARREWSRLTPWRLLRDRILSAKKHPTRGRRAAEALTGP